MEQDPICCDHKVYHKVTDAEDTLPDVESFLNLTGGETDGIYAFSIYADS